MMRHCIFLLTMALLPVASMAQTSGEKQPALILEHLSGNDWVYALSQVGKLTFANDSVYLVAHDGMVLGREAQAQIRKIAFADAELSATKDIQIADIRVYPNPATDYMVVSGLEKETVVRIYSADGKLLSATTAEQGKALLPVSHLAAGQYLLQVKTQIVKFIKQ